MDATRGSPILYKGQLRLAYAAWERGKTKGRSPETDPHQTLAEKFYWMEVGFGGEGLVHDEESQDSSRRRERSPTAGTSFTSNG